jgi:DNA-binding transcriptional regulator PaaX
MTKKEQLLSMLPLRFTKQEAVRIGACIGFSERIIGTYLQRLTNNGTLQRIAQGEYQFSELHA